MTLPRFTSALLLAAFAALSHSHGALAHADALLAQTEHVADDATRTLVGTVHALVIDDATRGTSSRHVEVALDDGTLVPLRGDDADTLASGAWVNVAGHFNGKWLEVESVEQVAGAANVVPKANVEIEGTLGVLHADDFAHGKSSFLYELRQASGKSNRLRLGLLPSALAPGMRLRVTGVLETDGESITPLRITILAQPSSVIERGDALAKAATADSVLVIMANFNNTATPGFSQSQVTQVMTSNSDSVANFFSEASYGSQIMNVTVTPGWVDIGMPQPVTCNDTDWQSIGSSAEAASKALGGTYDPAAYNFVVYVFPTVPSCGWLGLAYIGYPHKSWINGTGSFATSVVAHEVGHNFGLLHAGSLRCGSGIIGGSCSVAEYGDPFDTMGNQRAMHYNAMQKSKLSWIAPTTVQTFGGGSATYTLTPIEVAGGTTYAVKVPTTSANRTYWIEFRQPIGFDSPLSAFPNNGAQIRVSSPFETYCPGCDAWNDDTELLDMTPGTSAFTDAALVAGQTFTDSTYGINITVLSASASAMTVRVASGSSVTTPASTTTAVIGAPNPSLAGASTTFTATVNGAGPTGTVSFTDNGASIFGCSAVALSGSGNTVSAACTTNALLSGSHAILAAYSGDSGNAPSTSASLMQTVDAPTDGTNVALASNGGVASASSTWGPSFPAWTVIDNKRTGANWGTYSGWADATPSTFPDWVQINFNGTKTIDHVVVYSVQDNFLSPVEPTDSMTGTRFVLTSFDVQGWNGSTWVTLASVTGNNRIKRVVTFSAFSTDRIRVVVNGTQDGVWSRITEIEAWSSTTSSSTNFALASNGGTASASSTWGPSFPAWTVIDNKRSGANWGNYAGWADGTKFTFPDWVQIDFSATRTFDHVVVYSVQDNFLSPVEPTDAMTGTKFVLTSFDVQGWNGSAWVTLASVSGNNLIKRTVWFTPYATSQIRISVTGTQDGVWSRITEIEAWGQ